MMKLCHTDHMGLFFETLYISHVSRRDVAQSAIILWGGTRSLRMPALRPAYQAGPMRMGLYCVV